jgi:hypothetical protein
MVGNKLEQWNYEKEIRLISSAGGKNGFPTQSLAGIVFGVKTAPSFRDKVVEIASRRYQGAHLENAKLNASRGTIEVSSFPNSMIRKNAVAIVGDPAAKHRTLYTRADDDAALDDIP